MEDPWINLAGIAIGNGWVDPIYQYPAYNSFALARGMISAGHSLLLSLQYKLC